MVVSRARSWLARGVLATAAALTAAGFLGRWYWAFDLAANFRVQLLIIAGMSALVLAVRRRRGPLAVALAIAAINAALIVPLYVGRPTALADGARLTIGQINLQARKTEPDELLAAAARNELGDVFVLLEPTRGWNTFLVGKVGDYEVIDMKGQSDGLILTRLPVRDARHPDGQRVLPNPAIEFVIDAPGGPIQVLAVDAASPGRGRESNLRDRQLSAMAQWRSGRQGRVVLLGDWNVTPWASAYEDLVRATGLVPAESGYGLLPSYPAALGPLGLPIDHQLHTPDLTVTDVRLGSSFHSPHRSLFVTYALGSPLPN